MKSLAKWKRRINAGFRQWLIARQAELTSTLSSVVVHLAILLILAILFFPLPGGGKSGILLFSPTSFTESNVEIPSLSAASEKEESLTKDEADIQPMDEPNEVATELVAA